MPACTTSRNCVPSGRYKNKRKEYLGLADDDFSCVELYKTLLSKLTSFLASYPTDLIAFQTTSAGWMPYGNYGFAWNPNKYQPYSLSPNAVAHFNDAAKEAVGEAAVGVSLSSTDITSSETLILPREPGRWIPCM